MKVLFLSSIYSKFPHFDLILLIIGAFFVATVGLMSITFFIDDYWGDEGYRSYLRNGNNRKLKS